MLIKVKCSTCQLALVWTMHAAYWNGDRMCSSFSRHIERTALCIYLIIHFYARMSVIVTMTKTWLMQTECSTDNGLTVYVRGAPFQCECEGQEVSVDQPQSLYLYPCCTVGGGCHNLSDHLPRLHRLSLLFLCLWCQPLPFNRYTPPSTSVCPITPSNVHFFLFSSPSPLPPSPSYPSPPSSGTEPPSCPGNVKEFEPVTVATDCTTTAATTTAGSTGQGVLPILSILLLGLVGVIMK